MRGFVNITSRPLFPICCCCCSSPLAKRITIIFSFARSSVFFRRGVLRLEVSLFPFGASPVIHFVFFFFSFSSTPSSSRFVRIDMVSRSLFSRSYVVVFLFSFFLPVSFFVLLFRPRPLFPLRFLILVTSLPLLSPVRTLIHFPISFSYILFPIFGDGRLFVCPCGCATVCACVCVGLFVCVSEYEKG